MSVGISSCGKCVMNISFLNSGRFLFCCSFSSACHVIVGDDGQWFNGFKSIGASAYLSVSYTVSSSLSTHSTDDSWTGATSCCEASGSSCRVRTVVIRWFVCFVYVRIGKRRWCWSRIHWCQICGKQINYVFLCFIWIRKKLSITKKIKII